MFRPPESDDGSALQGATTATPPESGRVMVTAIGDYEIHALEYGSGDDVLILLHGLSGSSRWWARNIPGLAKERRLLVPDLIGFGRSRSSAPLPDIREVAHLLVDWIDSLGLKTVSLAGHSMGGQISVHVAALAPDRLDRLILVDSAGIPRPLSAGALLRFGAEVAPLWRWGDPSFLPIIAGDAWTAGPRVLLRAIRHIVEDDVQPLLGDLRVPTLIIWGERDTLVPLSDAWAFRQLIPGSRLVVLRGAAHNPMVDRPGAFNRVLNRFLDGEEIGR